MESGTNKTACQQGMPKQGKPCQAVQQANKQGLSKSRQAMKTRRMKTSRIKKITSFAFFDSIDWPWRHVGDAKHLGILDFHTSVFLECLLSVLISDMNQAPGIDISTDSIFFPQSIAECHLSCEQHLDFQPCHLQWRAHTSTWKPQPRKGSMILPPKKTAGFP